MAEAEKPIILIPEDAEKTEKFADTGEVVHAVTGKTEELLEQIDSKLDTLIASSEEKKEE